MIQRIQSIWLFLAAVCVFLTYKLPFYVGSHPKFAGVIHELTGRENFGLILLTFSTGAIAMVTIFLFTKRILQLRLCVAGILLQAVLIFLYYLQTKDFTDGSYALWAMLHSLSIVCFALAAKAINKDEKLIKESNRLR